MCRTPALLAVLALTGAAAQLAAGAVVSLNILGSSSALDPNYRDDPVEGAVPTSGDLPLGFGLGAEIKPGHLADTRFTNILTDLRPPQLLSQQFATYFSGPREVPNVPAAPPVPSYTINGPVVANPDQLSVTWSLAPPTPAGDFVFFRILFQRPAGSPGLTLVNTGPDNLLANIAGYADFDTGRVNYSFRLYQVPEPATAAMLFMAAGALACVRRRR